MEGPDGIAIRELVPADAQRYFDLIEYDRAHHSQTHSGETDETAEKYPDVESVLDSIVNPENPGIYFRFGIWDGETMVGSDNLRLMGNYRGRIGSWVGKEYAGHHYAARARNPLVQLAFDHFELNEVFSEILIGNEASRKSLEKSGFIYDGIVEGNKWVYKLHRQDWENLKSRTTSLHEQ